MAGLIPTIDYKKEQIKPDIPDSAMPEWAKTGVNLANQELDRKYNAVAGPYGYTNPNEGKTVPDGGPLGRDNPLSGQGYFPLLSRDLANEQANRGSEYFESALNYGTDPYFGAGSSDPMTQALEQTSGKYYGGDIMKAEAKASARDQAIEQKNRAVNQAKAIRANEIQNYNEQKNYENQRYVLYNTWKRAKDAAEASLIGSIANGFLTVGGGVLGFAVGGPAGAAVGAGAGSRLGGGK